MMDWLDSPLRWAPAILAALVAYELVRSWTLGTIRAALHRRVRRFLSSHDVRLDRFKLGTEQWVREELLNDMVVAEAILARARETGRRPEEVRRDVEGWIDEIVPRFSLLAYYQLGSLAARLGVNALYTPIIDVESAKAARRAPEGASVIYLMNHRSNADYILVAYFLLRSVSISYAVGEWARVWPLDALFKSFGGYFVRRGFKEPLYHKVLERYVQLVTRRGVTQGIFPEGGLSRDGALRQPKVGLMDAIVKLLEEPGFERDIVLVPVGLNFDRVLEDSTLVAEGRAKVARPPGPVQKLASLVKIVLSAPFVILTNVARAATGRLRRLGYASVRFGQPFSLRARVARLPGGKLPPGDEERRAFVKEVAAEVMGQIARLVPATPVSLVARALETLPEHASIREVETAVAQAIREVTAGGGRVVLGKEFRHLVESRAALDEAEHRRKEMLELEQSLLDTEEADHVARVGLRMLARRRLIRLRKGLVHTPEKSRPLIAYYAKSLEGFPAQAAGRRAVV